MPKPAKTQARWAVPIRLSFALLGSLACAKQSTTGVAFTMYSDWEEVVCEPVGVRVNGQKNIKNIRFMAGS